MSLHQEVRQQQDQNTGKLVISTFYKVAKKEGGVTAADIAKYLQEKYGDVWRISTLIGKAETTLKRSANLGFLDKRGDRYVANLTRELKCGRRRRRRRSCKRRRPRRRRSRRRRRRRRRRPCCCK